jgi:hypothetical protein
MQDVFFTESNLNFEVYKKFDRMFLIPFIYEASPYLPVVSIYQTHPKHTAPRAKPTAVVPVPASTTIWTSSF